MASVASIDVLDPSDEATRLLECFRGTATQYQVGVSLGESGSLLVTDMGNRTSDLYDFLRQQLDACGRELGIDWRRYLDVPPPG